MRKPKLFTIAFTCALAALAFVLVAQPTMAADKPKIIFCDFGWDSAQVHNRIANFIIKHGLGYETDFVPGETIMLNKALIQAKKGAPNVNMETWTENWQDLYDEGFAKGKDPNTKEGFVNLGPNFPNSVQGFWVPTYIIKGDEKRGIKASAPDLKTVEDLKKYWELFKDPEDPSKGRFFSCIPGWSCSKVNQMKFKAYDLLKNYNIMEPGSGPALAASMEAAYKKGKPWLGYYWAPTWIMGKLDMTMLEEPAYEQKTWDSTKGCAYPAVKCDIVVAKGLIKTAPDVVEFLKKYETTMKINNAFLLHMQNKKGKPIDGAKWFMTEYESLWTTWVSPEVAAKVKAALK